MNSAMVEILLVEDEPNIADGIIFNLEAESYRVIHCQSAEEALKELPLHNFSLLVLDIMLPGMDGLKLCRQLRASGSDLPILMLTARGDEDDRVAGLSEGADDYLTKPFSLKEFLLRVKGLLRRSQGIRTASQTYTFGANRVDLTERRALTHNGELELTELEVKMLTLFFSREGRILSRGELLQSVWGMKPNTETRTLDNFIVRLRKYFELNPAKPLHFQTVRGRGYRFVRGGDFEGN
ncbi:response regulator transcription factor [Geopsychrobacter electrodiphilus]|uniref:response regulator transcription factor n=1 Tax=Geopsychrobacter electrodiphilus TaxID=225196 RepID=UPI000374E411|nr:response regulator transcription factor [Geopsychrobacter electrodiphilus]